MADGDEQLGTNQGSRDRGIHITVYENNIWLVFKYNRFETAHDLGRLLRVTSRSHAEICIWFWNFQLGKEYVRHVSIVMLAGVKERLPDTASLNGPQHGRRFHEVRPGSDYVKNLLHFMIAANQPLAFLSSTGRSHRTFFGILAQPRVG
jgi:hypothetical protein